jgi:hypothetical protein
MSDTAIRLLGALGAFLCALGVVLVVILLLQSTFG